EKLSQLIEKIEGKVVLIGGKGESEIGQRLASANCINTAGKCNIGTSASLIKGCRVVLTPDTGMMHIAAALKKPIVSVWGNTVPQFGMYPYYGNQLVNEFRADRKSTRLNSSHVNISYAVFCLKKKNKT